MNIPNMMQDGKTNKNPKATPGAETRQQIKMFKKINPSTIKKYEKLYNSQSEFNSFIDFLINQLEKKKWNAVPNATAFYPWPTFINSQTGLVAENHVVKFAPAKM